MKWYFGSGLRGCRACERWAAEGQSMRYFWSSAAIVRRTISCSARLGDFRSVRFIVKGSMRTLTSRWKKDLACSPSCWPDGAAAVLRLRLVRLRPRLVTLPKTPASALGDLKRSMRVTVRRVPVRLRIEMCSAMMTSSRLEREKTEGIQLDIKN